MLQMILIVVGIFFILLGIYGYLTNPFVRFTLIVDPFKQYSLSAKTIISSHKLIVRWRRVFKLIAMIKSGWHIVLNSFSRRKRALGTELNQIIQHIHAIRFNPALPFIISGDHFSVLYPRSLGIFYYTALDPRIPSSNDDWLNRQLIYTKTLLYALSVYDQTETLSTTIVPINRLSVAQMNIYAYSSDTLYSLLSAIENLSSSKKLEKTYPFSTTYQHALATKKAIKAIKGQYFDTLKRHWERYSFDVFDKHTGLIKAHWHLSGTKDIAKRSSAFYDNVIYWRTRELAQKLKLCEKDPASLKNLKQRILTDYWDEKRNQFYEDKSAEGREKGWGSSDWLIAYQTGFLSPSNENDLPYLKKAVDTIIESRLDQPFGMRYHNDIRPKQLYWPVRLGAPLYGSQVIWSHWGMEYIKLLCHMAQVTQKPEYLQRAEAQLNSYEQNIIDTKGYPEVYDPKGQPYRHWLYASVHQTGWVINFEQTKEMVLSTAKIFTK
jgi:hypothetical protein